MYDWPDITRTIALKSGNQLNPLSVQHLSGGDNNATFILGESPHALFVKINTKDRLDMFQAEASGLLRIKQTNSLIVPSVYCIGISGEHAFIAMQYLSMQQPHKQSHRDFGHKLATMHKVTQTQYGGDINNTIGTTPQINTWTTNWYDFWRQHRLYYQLNIAQQRNSAPTTLIDEGHELGEKMQQLFSSIPPAASCLHGDLWQGNWGFDTHGMALVFDPAHYFGDRETDIAMTRLFGAAHPDFYAAYSEIYPLSDNYTIRETFYNIYHILNHYNLFGGSYLKQAQHMIRLVLSELR